MPVELILFWIFAGIAVLSALLCITRTSPVASALWLVMTLFQIAALFVLLDAQFLAVLQVLVYAGAIMVLFLFVIMLLNLGRLSVSDMKGPAGLAVATFLAGALGQDLGPAGRGAPPGGTPPADAPCSPYVVPRGRLDAAAGRDPRHRGAGAPGGRVITLQHWLVLSGMVFTLGWAA